MAKGNLFLGQARGKLGSMVFSVRKGVQIERVRNTSPANPKTPSQVAQRMKMYAPTKLYRMASQNFFKFAYPLRSSETIFNGMMRENVAIAPFVSKQLVSQQGFPLFPAKISSGNVGGYKVYSGYSNLGDIHLEQADENVAYLFAAPFEQEFQTRQCGVCLRLAYVEDDGDIENFGYISRRILELRSDLREGDKITLVFASSSSITASLNSSDVVFNPNGVDTFSHFSFILDSTSTEPISGKMIVDEREESASLVYVWKRDIPAVEATGVAAAVVVTRQEGSAVKASLSVMALDPYANAAYTIMRSAEYEREAALSYSVAAVAPLDPKV